MVTLPASAPAAVGRNRTTKLQLCPGVNTSPIVHPLLASSVYCA
jgi:hypothetical protein